MSLMHKLIDSFRRKTYYGAYSHDIFFSQALDAFIVFSKNFSIEFSTSYWMTIV